MPRIVLLARALRIFIYTFNVLGSVAAAVLRLKVKDVKAPKQMTAAVTSSGPTIRIRPFIISIYF